MRRCEDGAGGGAAAVGAHPVPCHDAYGGPASEGLIAGPAQPADHVAVQRVRPAMIGPRAVFPLSPSSKMTQRGRWAGSGTTTKVPSRIALKAMMLRAAARRSRRRDMPFRPTGGSSPRRTVPSRLSDKIPRMQEVATVEERAVSPSISMRGAPQRPAAEDVLRESVRCSPLALTTCGGGEGHSASRGRPDKAPSPGTGRMVRMV